MSHLKVMLSARAAKAYVGGAVAALSYAVPVVDDGMLPSEVLGVLLAALVGFQAVYWVSNPPTSDG